MNDGSEDGSDMGGGENGGGFGGGFGGAGSEGAGWDLSLYKMNRAIGLLMAGHIQSESTEFMEEVLYGYLREEFVDQGIPLEKVIMSLLMELYNLNMMTLSALSRETGETGEVWLRRMGEGWIANGGGV